MRYKYTDKDIEWLKEYYPKGDWNLIFSRFPNCTKSSIHHKMSRMGVAFNNENRDYDFVKKKRIQWTNEEDSILKNMYSNHSIDEVQKFLHTRSKNSIILRANKLGILSQTNINTLWSEEDKQFIYDNWKLMPDKLMAKKLNRTFRSVKAKREELGLYRRNMDDNTYTNLSKYLRGQNQKWKKDSARNCNYKCVLTSSKKFQIHHLYSVSNIINDIFKENRELYKENFENYSEDELSYILELFLEKQNNYPLGVCIDKNIHKLFHSLYGQYHNTPEQWYAFVNDYMKGEYSDLITG